MPNVIKYKAEDLIGQKIGKLYITGPEERRVINGKTTRLIYADCDCGNKQVLVKISSIVGDNPQQSCGCLSEETRYLLGHRRHTGEIQSKGNTSHGDSKTYSPYHQLYSSWMNMRSRCKYKSCDNYEWYGGRGIRVCEEWENSYTNFKNWALENGWQPGLEIDRIDSDKNYTPDNCRWSTRKEQNNNSSHNVRINLYGMDMTMTQWGEFLGIAPKSIAAKIYRGRTPEEAVNSYINPNPEIKKPFIFVK